MPSNESPDLRVPVEAAELKTFDVSPTRGFLPEEDPLSELPAAWRNWEEIGRELPRFLLAGRVRSVLDAMTSVDPAALEDDRQLRRARPAKFGFISPQSLVAVEICGANVNADILVECFYENALTGCVKDEVSPASRRCRLELFLPRRAF